MVNFAELKAKAEKAKDASVTKVTNTKDKYSSVPSSKTNWDPNWKRAPPPPAPSGSTSSASQLPPTSSLRSRPDGSSDSLSAAPPPVIPRASRPVNDISALTAYTPPPPPTRAASGYPPSHRGIPRDVVDEIDWTNLSPANKEEFFEWLDEFFSRYLSIELSPRQPKLLQSPGRSVSVASAQNARPPPTVNMATRP
ncbi:hypothetical protein BS17DRAFT_320457 [Gyrodon lividus]|nr:hypothetical protein BS17DRAFT_320457 [Gyrodon lividus]